MTGVGGLLRFMLRRERFALPWWLLGATLLMLVQSTHSQNLYDTPEDLAKLRQSIGGNTAVIAMSGPTRLLQTIGGEVVFEIFAFVSIVVALMNMFLIGRHTRADEESGRAELVRSARVGRRATLAAALTLAGLANLAVGLLTFAAAAGTGLSFSGSVHGQPPPWPWAHRWGWPGGCSARRWPAGRPACSCWARPTVRSATASSSTWPTTPRWPTSCPAVRRTSSTRTWR
jgi:hypothetical protein